jgi:hypothetical protein
MDSEISQQLGLQPATTTNRVGVSFSTMLALSAGTFKKLGDPTKPCEISADP